MRALLCAMALLAMGVLAANNPDETQINLGSRHYFVVNPRAISSSGPKAPIVLFLHGLNCACNQATETQKLREALANAHLSALVVSVCAVSGSWDLSATGGDAGFVKQVIADVATKYNVDTKLVFAEGFSMGGMLVSVIGCATGTNVFTLGFSMNGCGIQCGGLGAGPAYVLAVEGKSDNVCPYSHQLSSYNSWKSFARLQGCANSDALSTSTQKCSGKEVDFYYVDGWHAVIESGSFSGSATSVAFMQARINELNGGGGSSTCQDSGHENAAVSLSCDAGQVITSVDFASYGTPSGSCSAGFSKSSCDSSTSVSVVQNACLGKQSCSVTANNDAFGDPCPRTMKHLAVKVSCGSNKDNTCGIADEGSSLTLGCAVGKKITKVDFATYGTPQGDCQNHSTGKCHAANSQSKMEEACLNKNSCTVQASNSVFGDPCSGTIKKLAAIITCK